MTYRLLISENNDYISNGFPSTSPSTDISSVEESCISIMDDLEPLYISEIKEVILFDLTNIKCSLPGLRWSIGGMNCISLPGKILKCCICPCF